MEDGNLSPEYGSRTRFWNVVYVKYISDNVTLVKWIDLCHRSLDLDNLEYWHCVSVSEIIGFVSDMHACASQIIEHFSTKMSPGEHSADSLNSNPAKLCFVVKQSVREAAVGGCL